MNYQILLASPSLSEKELMSLFLREAGYVVDTPLSAEDLLKLIDEKNYDVIIVDADFASSEQGWLLARQLKQSFRKSKLGIILMTKTLPAKYLPGSGFEVNYDELLFFPISDEELLYSVRNVIKHLE